MTRKLFFKAIMAVVAMLVACILVFIANKYLVHDVSDFQSIVLFMLILIYLKLDNLEA